MNALLSLTVTLLFSLLLVHLVNRREQRRREIRWRQRRARAQIEGLEEVLIGLEETLSNRRIAECVNREIQHQLEAALALENGRNTHLETRLNHVKERAEELENNRRQARANRLRESDAQLARTRECLDQAARVLRRQHNQGRLERETLDDFLKELGWTRLMVEVVTYVAEGHKSLQRGDITSALAYYKKAQGLLIASDHPNPHRMEIIRELGEMIQGKRKALSPELMPETDYNP